MTTVHQWDIVRFKIRPTDKDAHPGIILSGEEWCRDSRELLLNVMACTKRVPAEGAKPYNTLLNGADGLEFQTLVDCRFIHIAPKAGVSEIIGRVSPERRKAIGRKINEVLRLSL